MGLGSRLGEVRISRRGMLTAGVVAAASVVAPVRGGFGAALSPDPYRAVSRKEWARQLGSTFRVRLDGAQTADVVLTAIEDAPLARDPRRTPSADHDAFSLHFQGAGRASIPQGTYQLDHDALGATMLLLVPDAGRRGKQASIATINRL